MNSAYNTSKAASGKLVDSLLGGSALNYIVHRACLRGESSAARRERKHAEMGDLVRRKELVGGQERNRLQMVTRNEEWLIAVLHCLNGTELYQEEFRDNICLRYGLMPQDIPQPVMVVVRGS